ncbi:MAG TPA: S8 family serine peptidase [Candidatus Limnocylindrales bacterium]|nr:S8 family serine peptidase [Candidatus Limnocylindrales bacterium]
MTHRARVRVSVAALAMAIAVAALALPRAGGARALSTPGALPTGISSLLASTAADATSLRGIATFGAVPTAAQVAGLESLGLVVQPMRHVPLALVAGPATSMETAVVNGTAEDVYPDEAIELLDTASSDSMGAGALRAAGLTGRGVTVAVVDSGCDASHPDLADHVVHNVKLYSAEYANVPPDASNRIVVANETGPYQNTDIGGGHGTHVAGIIAADSTTDPAGTRFGVAPDASLVCYSIGEVLFTTAVVTAYDHMLDQPDLWGIDVVNNSWGNSFRQFDPRDPVSVVTKAVADMGVIVVFAAGNSGYEDAEMSLNPFSEAPWVISVAAGSLDHQRGNFSSNGLIYDNSQPTQIGGGGHTWWTGDRIGTYHPDVTAPGVAISSTCDTAGTVIGPCPPPDYGNAVADGTSMASPHVAGAAAVLLQANPALTPDQVRSALQATATPVAAPDGSALPFWEAGYGYVDLNGAVSLVRSKSWSKDLPKAQSRADARVLGADGFGVTRTDMWTYDAPRGTVAGTDSHTYAVAVPIGTTHVKVTLSHPSLAVVGINGLGYTVTVRDAAGQLLGTTTESLTEGAGTASAFIDLRSFQNPPVAFGAFTFDVSGDYAASDPDTLDSDSLLGRMVTLQVAQVIAGR